MTAGVFPAGGTGKASVLPTNRSREGPPDVVPPATFAQPKPNADFPCDGSVGVDLRGGISWRGERPVRLRAFSGCESLECSRGDTVRRTVRAVGKRDPSARETTSQKPFVPLFIRFWLLLAA